jgi:hypothetical protein
MVQCAPSYSTFRVDPARFGDLSARPSNPASQVRRSRPVTFLQFPTMQRTSDDMEDRLDVGTLLERISAEQGHPIENTGRHRLLPDTDTRRSRRRRFAPVVAGVATVAVATTVALTLRPGDASVGPELDAALVGAASVAPTPTGYPAPDAIPTDQETAPTSTSRVTATAASKATIKPAAVRRSTAGTATKQRAERSSAATTSRAPR